MLPNLSKNYNYGLAMLLWFISLWRLIDSHSLMGNMLEELTLHLAFVALILSLIYVICRRYLLFLNFSAIFIYNIVVILISVPFSTYICNKFSNSRPPINVLTYNTWNKNRHQSNIVNTIKVQRPDIIWLQEVHKQTYIELIAHFPSYFSSPSVREKAPQSSVLFSKYKIERVQTIAPKDTSMVHFVIYFENEKINFIGVHLTSPKTQNRLNKRNEQIRLLENYILAKQLDNLIVAGDFNSAPWVHQMDIFDDNTKLSSSYRLIDHYGSWPSYLPQQLAIPIDRVYFNRQFYLLDLHVLDYKGSDHLAINTKLGICSESANGS